MEPYQNENLFNFNFSKKNKIIFRNLNITFNNIFEISLILGVKALTIKISLSIVFHTELLVILKSHKKNFYILTNWKKNLIGILVIRILVENEQIRIL